MRASKTRRLIAILGVCAAPIALSGLSGCAFLTGAAVGGAAAYGYSESQEDDTDVYVESGEGWEEID